MLGFGKIGHTVGTHEQRQERAVELPIILRPGEDGWIVAECPLIPGCITQGRTRQEALDNAREAIELCLESQAEEGWTLPAEYEVAALAISR